MVGNGEGLPDDEPGAPRATDPAMTRGSGLIFILIAIALVLAIGFFYLTKDRENGPERAVTDAANSADSAVRLVGDAAQNAADQIGNRR
ncbi:hypothetical protein L288_07395 [Sphingobium quisquiliarum P25]|uniref:Uncharacterized protein n=1 Tax=Sphingobium quisquiliarum P25 TaxID=1329909 RepID=T0IAM7_9SPHN|nr:hypothetical protein [Sphingobium quisquiliarum]EQB08740.1 hypothetical protein L288_07395 [Sphingobium quisquiliarum P25]